ncbi:MAG: site-specific integrase, partial [Phycisphaerae bacterium]|nr:site-specific integrase [Phycisphaerae bacterium]
MSRPSRPSASSPHREGGMHLRGFLDYLQAECGLSLNTRKAYQRDLRHFLAHLSEARLRDLGRLKPHHIQDFLQSRRRGGQSVASVARALAAVRMFCRYLVIQHVLTQDISSSIDAPKKWHRLPTVLDEEALRLLLEAPDAGQDVHALRDRAILATLYATGIRASELASLNVGDVNFNLGVLRVLGKGSKERIVPAAQAALNAVSRYIHQYRPLLLHDTHQQKLMLSR